MTYYFEGAGGSVQEMESPSSYGGLGDMSSWFQNVAGDAVKTALGAYQIRTIKAAGGIPAVSESGRVYTEGQRASAPGVLGGGGSGSGGMFGLSSSALLLIAAAALGAVILLKD